MANVKEAITAIREALAQPEQKPVCAHGIVKTKCSFCHQPEQEPVAWPHKYGCRANAFGKCDMGCTTPPQRKPLTDEEIKEIIGPWGDTPIKGYTRKLFDQIEAKLRSKNT